MKVDAAWHRQHPMPAHPTIEQRIAWHVEHQGYCACRPIPLTVDRAIAARSGVIELKVDRAIYLVDNKNHTYRFLRRNSDWQTLDPVENDRNKRRIDGYIRIFRDGTKKTFRFGRSAFGTARRPSATHLSRAAQSTPGTSRRG